MEKLKTIQDSLTDIIEERTAAAQSGFRNSVLPVYGADVRGLAVHIGSCILFSVGNTKYLLTAAHIVDEHKKGSSLFVVGKGRLVELEADFTITKAPFGERAKDKYDFAFAKLSARMLNELGKTPFVAECDIVRQRDETSGRLYVALGYPNSKNKIDDHSARQIESIIWAYSGPAWKEAAFVGRPEKFSADHIALKFDRKQSKDVRGRIVNSFNPKGLSGGALIDMGNMADPQNWVSGSDQRGRLAGVLTEMHRKTNGFILATRMSVILEAIARGG